MHSALQTPATGVDGPSATGGFRKDINGLRAWAVLAVLAFHFGAPGFQGGYIGVDVFFVISGFLMTGIVVSGLERGDFSFWRFVLARALRIVPALAMLCACLLALGWCLLSAMEYEALATQALSSLGFVSNLLFWHQAGYFDAEAHDKWLLHTWSLSVEWQFYLALPLALMWTWRFRPGRAGMRSLAIVAILVSATICVVSTPLRQTDAFYLLPARVWEMLLGGLVYLRPERTVLSEGIRRTIEAIGYGLIIVAILSFDSATQWPGWAASVPTFGTALVLVAARQHSLLSGTRIAQWVGSRSYSIYLWHWPVVVGLGYLHLQQNWAAVSVGIAIVIVLSDLSYRYVETVFASAKHGSRKYKLGLAAALTLGASALSAWAIAHNGVPGRMSAAVEAAAAEAKNRNPKQPVVCESIAGNPGLSCRYGASRIGAILIGDSHAGALASALAEAGRDRGFGVLVWTYPACPTLFSAKMVPGLLRTGKDCAAFNRWAAGQLHRYPADIPVVLISRTSVYALGPNEAWETAMNRPQVYFGKVYTRPEPAFLREFGSDLTQSACRLAREREVFLVRPIPEMGVDVPKTVSRYAALGLSVAPSVSLVEYRSRHHTVWQAQDNAKAQCGITVLDPLPYLCDAMRCSSVAHGRPLYYDDDHLSEYGNKKLVPMFQGVF